MIQFIRRRSEVDEGDAGLYTLASKEAAIIVLSLQ